MGPAEDLNPARELRATVASLRVDAVAAAAFGGSRSRLVREIRAGRLSCNGRVTVSPAAPVREGDVLSLAGRGVCAVARVEGPTRKGRTTLVLRRLPAGGTQGAAGAGS